MRVFEKRVLRRIFGHNREEGAGGWRKLCNKFCNLYTSSNIIRMMKSRRMRGARHVACTRDMRNVHAVFLENLKGRDYLGDLA
jgi:hypothetical protein